MAYSPWQTKFMVDKLEEFPEWKINLELEPESWDTIAINDPGSYTALRQDSGSVDTGPREYINPTMVNLICTYFGEASSDSFTMACASCGSISRPCLFDLFSRNPALQRTTQISGRMGSAMLR